MLSKHADCLEPDPRISSGPVVMRTAPKAGHMTAADQIVTASKKSLDPRAPSTHEHLARYSAETTLIKSQPRKKIQPTVKIPPRTIIAKGQRNAGALRASSCDASGTTWPSACGTPSGSLPGSADAVE